MSANNQLIIDKRTFKVHHMDVSGCGGYEIGQGKDLDEAIEIAKSFMEEEIVEYGMDFIN